MYSQHFGLTQDPFSIAPDPRYLFMSERHREALAHLLFGVAGSGGQAGAAAGGTGGGFVLLNGLAPPNCPSEEPVALTSPGATPLLAVVAEAVCPPNMPLNTLARWRALTFCTW